GRSSSGVRLRCGATRRSVGATAAAGPHWAVPDGGLFLWVELPPGLWDDEVSREAIEHSVAVVPGSGFFVGPPQHGFLRLNFSNQSVSNIELGMARLGRTLFDLQGRSRFAAETAAAQ